MTVSLNHTIVWCTDKEASARFYVEILGLPAPTPFGPFLVVQLSNGVSLDFSDARGASIIESQRDEGRSGIYDKAQWRAIDSRCEAEMASPIGVENQDAVGSRSEDGRLGRNVGR